MAHYEVPDKAPKPGEYKYTYYDGDRIPDGVQVVGIDKAMNGRVRLVVVKVDNPPQIGVQSASTP